MFKTHWQQVKLCHDRMIIGGHHAMLASITEHVKN